MNNGTERKRTVNNTIRKCRGCKKILPDGYKSKYCEACLNKRADTGRKLLKVGIAVVSLTPLGKILPKKK